METRCTNCDQTIKNVITIEGKPYGTKCAEIILGYKLPTGYTGSWDKKQAAADAIQKKAETNALQKKIRAEQKAKEQRVVELWDEAMFLAGLWFNANDWARDFLLSVSSQLGYNGLLNCIHPKEFNSADDYLKNRDKKYEVFTTLRTKSIAELSAKQQAVLNKLSK